MESFPAASSLAERQTCRTSISRLQLCCTGRGWCETTPIVRVCMLAAIFWRGSPSSVLELVVLSCQLFFPILASRRVLPFMDAIRPRRSARLLLDFFCTCMPPSVSSRKVGGWSNAKFVLDPAQKIVFCRASVISSLRIDGQSSRHYGTAQYAAVTTV